MKLLKYLIMLPLGYIVYYRLNMVNKLKVTGLEKLHRLPNKNVMFVSNHQSYYADVAAIVLLMCAAKWGRKKYIGIPYYLLLPKLNFYYVAAVETMKESGLLPKIFALCGAITVKRTWREKGQEIHREVDKSDQEHIVEALKSSWLISFPQGTTTPYAPGRKGTGYLIKETGATVMPVQIDGFRRAFDKRGLFFKKRGVELKVNFGDPIKFSNTDSVENIMDEVMREIGQNTEED